MSLPTSPTDAMDKAGRAISNVLMGSEQKPIKEEEQVNFKDLDQRQGSSSRPTVQLSFVVPGDAGGGAGTGGLGAESSLGSSDESSEDSRAYHRRRKSKKCPGCFRRKSRGMGDTAVL